jgi:hypothetical protein
MTAEDFECGGEVAGDALTVEKDARRGRGIGCSGCSASKDFALCIQGLTLLCSII